MAGTCVITILRSSFFLNNFCPDFTPFSSSVLDGGRSGCVLSPAPAPVPAPAAAGGFRLISKSLLFFSMTLFLTFSALDLKREGLCSFFYSEEALMEAVEVLRLGLGPVLRLS